MSVEALVLFQRELRGLVIDNEQRDQGAPVSVAPYDSRRRWRCCGVCGPINFNPGAGGMDINGQTTLGNSSGSITIRPTAHNFTATVNFTGSAGNRPVILSKTGRDRGDRLTVVCALPTTEGLVLTFLNGPSGNSLLPELRFEDGEFYTDGIGTSATFDFYFDGSNWHYEEASIPA